MTAGLPPDAAALAAVPRPGGARLAVVRGGAVRYVAVNPRVPPFGDPDARRALAAILDREAMHEAAGGRLAGELATHFIPPGVRGFEEAGGARGPGLDFLAPPGGDLLLARRYLARAAPRASRRPLVVAGVRGGPEEVQSRLVAAALRRLGLATRLRLTASPRAAALACHRTRSPVALCPNASRRRRIADAQGILDPPADDGVGGRRSPLGRADGGVAAAIGRARELTDPTARTRAWAAVDRLLSERAAAVPWLWEAAVLVGARDVRGVPNRSTGAWDLSYSSLR